MLQIRWEHGIGRQTQVHAKMGRAGLTDWAHLLEAAYKPKDKKIKIKIRVSCGCLLPGHCNYLNTQMWFIYCFISRDWEGTANTWRVCCHHPQVLPPQLLSLITGDTVLLSHMQTHTAADSNHQLAPRVGAEDGICLQSPVQNTVSVWQALADAQRNENTFLQIMRFTAPLCPCIWSAFFFPSDTSKES